MHVELWNTDNTVLWQLTEMEEFHQELHFVDDD
jgi:hypothetical protein